LAVHETPTNAAEGPLRTETPSHGENGPLKLARYEIVRELGKGAMGIVYLAKDPLIGRLVALKTIRPAAHSDDDETKEFQQRFVREAQAAGILNHPAIVTVHDIGQDDASGMSFIAMEYVEGHNLKEVLAQGRALSFEQIGDIASQVAEALDFAHAKGIVHRDVKPANVILIEGNRAKITDFGIAKIASGGANLTSTGQFLGTPNYMAPEQIKGAPVDGRTDIFSLGICIYEMLTRRKPFGGDSLTSISYKIVHEPFPPLLDINPQIPEGYQDVVAQCLAKDPAKRYQRGRDLANALKAVIRGERPVRVEPMLADETVVTRADRDKLPTVEVPFPEADQSPGVDTKAHGQVPPVPPPPAATPPKARAPRAPLGPKVRKTLTNVRAMPLWKTPIPAAIFLGIAAVLIVGLVAAVVTIRSKHVKLRPVDTRAATRIAREHQLRTEANELIHKGRVAEAYAKYVELSKLAPGSPAVIDTMRRLEATLDQSRRGQVRLDLAKQKFDEGLVLYNEKKFAEATPLFLDSFHINPSSEEAAKYLKLSQQEELKAQEAKAARQRAQQQRQVATTTTTTHATTTTAHDARGTAGGDGAGHAATTTAASTAPAQLTTATCRCRSARRPCRARTCGRRRGG